MISDRLDLSTSCRCTVSHQPSDPVKVYLVRWNGKHTMVSTSADTSLFRPNLLLLLSDYTIELIACVDGHVSQCVKNIPSYIRLQKLSEIINDVVIKRISYKMNGGVKGMPTLWSKTRRGVLFP